MDQTKNNSVPNALIDLSTFTMDFKAYTQHNGSGGALGPTGYCQSRIFPRNPKNLIEAMEIKTGGGKLDNSSIIDTSLIFLMILLLEQMLQIKTVGQNADPSCKYYSS